ncbi:hypothetical protein [Pseudomonas sp. TCU-HL1]|uniref:hypothetical protein n=1 Tax=Pseudomonas sp. TCU-HL1 TaxID=1856685 RepID=UPI0008580784|nr:hypothetical protein [Pseudomonas sp. TCU-HL1]AOE88130.1 hypothetical protein THL1_5583 [Pseudomonas sp. TCU-HL1]
MFLTHQHSKIDQYELFGDDPTAWSCVEHNIHRPWFYVGTTELAEDFDLHPMLMLSNERLLQSLVADQVHGLRMDSVLLVTPDHLNQSGRWLMEPLESIERIESAAGVAYSYQVQGDRTYIYGDAEAATLQGARRVTLFSSSMLSSSPL